MSAGADNPNTTSAQPLDQNECFELLSNQRRRYLLHYLKCNGEAANLGELAQQIAAWENEITPEEVTYKERKRVYTSLQQVHLPRMDKMGVVEFDDRAGSVETGPAAEELDVYIEVVTKKDIPWSVFYLGLSLINLVLIGIVSVGGLIGGSNLQFGVGMFCVISYLFASLAHIYINRTEMRLGNTSYPPEMED